jgi:hypothetical protein
MARKQYRKVEWGRMRVVKWAAGRIQKELDVLREELNGTNAGQKWSRYFVSVTQNRRLPSSHCETRW